jgi:hypothetical protein
MPPPDAQRTATAVIVTNLDTTEESAPILTYGVLLHAHAPSLMPTATTSVPYADLLLHPPTQMSRPGKDTLTS